ncbi:hypothetical protein [Vagococcus fluvialis]|uniref:hypothetical protein n=1 Tax=Vagococcus fluvialis TaxID=2738 RepID=UPI001D0B74C9|nr:hypothetical protein [Vagococcus fluvialis]UDM84068.1 hypothetical protein K5K96_15255 [Vagococcus fluvialis]
MENIKELENLTTITNQFSNTELDKLVTEFLEIEKEQDKLFKNLARMQRYDEINEVFQKYNFFNLKVEEKIDTFDNKKDFINHFLTDMAKDFLKTTKTEIYNKDVEIVKAICVKRLEDYYNSSLLEKLQQLLIAKHLIENNRRFKIFSSINLDMKLGVDFIVLVENKKDKSMINYYNFHTTTSTANALFKLEQKKLKSYYLKDFGLFDRKKEYNPFSHFHINVLGNYIAEDDKQGQLKQMKSEIERLFKSSALDILNSDCDSLKLLNLAETLGENTFTVIEN